ncbi:LysR family transcriptional regulator [Reinekea sp.]|uniref:LysR family transcriptional regulator n=1 Tax=Reinekea sp. TaxID=1970455 RepID=UPI002A83218C|nr:LysR family transcriptional regulator [Reinekea sp.]
MDWNDLKYLIAVSDKGSLKTAAKHLGVNHTTVWRKMQSLEAQLDCQLFTASRSGYRLTEAGEAILADARRMESLADSIRFQSQARLTEIRGLIRLTAPGEIAFGFLPKIIAEFQVTYPRVEFEILEETRSLNISNREADIAIRATSEIPDNLIGRKIRDIPWALFASKEFVKQHKVQFGEGEYSIDGLPVIPYRLFDSPAARWFNEKTLHNPRPVATNRIKGAYQYALNHMGIALLPYMLAEPLVELYRLPDNYNSQLWLLANKDLRNTARIKTFWDFLQTRLVDYLPDAV